MILWKSSSYILSEDYKIMNHYFKEFLSKLYDSLCLFVKFLGNQRWNDVCSFAATVAEEYLSRRFMTFNLEDYKIINHNLKKCYLKHNHRYL